MLSEMPQPRLGLFALWPWSQRSAPPHGRNVAFCSIANGGGESPFELPGKCHSVVCGPAQTGYSPAEIAFGTFDSG
jgi:hypothetical protein